MRTATLSIIPIAAERDRAGVLERIPADRRAMATVATLPEAAELLGRYVAAGFGGFIFRNVLLRSPESIGLAGELIRLMRFEGASA